jgi:hypothetical protein
MIDQDFSGADHVVDPQDASSYHFVNSSDINTIQDQKQPLEYANKVSYSQFQDSRQVYQPSLAPYSADAQTYAADTQQRPYDGTYQPTNAAAVNTTDGSHTFHSSEMAPIARTASDASEHGSSTAEGLSEALGALKIDETGTGRNSFRQEV